MKADLFVLSGRDVLSGGPDFISEFNKECGSPNCKVVAVSTMDSYLRKIDDDQFLGVDFTFPKGKLIKDMVLADSGRIQDVDFVLNKILEAVS